MPGPSSAFVERNAALDRRPRIVVGFRAPGDADWKVKYATGGVGARPFVTSASAISSTFNLSTLSSKVGDMTVGLLPMDIDGGAITQPELFAQGPDAWRELGVLLGFDNMAEADYLEVFSGYVVGWPAMNATEFSVRATDGMDLVRRLDRSISPSETMWGSPLSTNDISIAFGGVLAVLNFALSTAAGIDPREGSVIDEGDIGAWFGYLAGLPPVDTRLLGSTLIKRGLPEASDPKRFLEALTPAFGFFLSRYPGGAYRLPEIQPRDKDPDEGPFFGAVTIGDDDIVSVSTKWAADDRVRSVTMNYGLLCWDSFDDIATTDAVVQDLKNYENNDLGKYLLAHQVQVVPYAGDLRQGRRMDGRDVKVDAAGVFMAQGDLEALKIWEDSGRDRDPDGEEVDPPADWDDTVHSLRPGPKLDTLNFPVRYAGFRRSWESTDWTIPLDHAARLPSDHVHTLHQAAARILRAGFLPSITLDLVIQARKGATISVGDTVRIGSSHIPNVAMRQIGMTSIEESASGQVLSTKPDPMAGTVAVSLRLGMRNPSTGSAPLWVYANEIAHSSGSWDQPSPLGWNQGDPRPNWIGPNDRQYATGRAIGTGVEHEGGWADVGNQREAVYWLYLVDQAHIGPVTVYYNVPRAIACESYEMGTQSAFHYVRLRCSWTMINKSITTGHWIATVRLSLLSGPTLTIGGIQEPLAVEWSEIVEIPFRLDGQIDKVGEFTHSICCPGQKRGPDIRHPDPIEEGGTIKGWDASYGATKGDVDQEYFYRQEDTGELDWVSRGVQVGDDILVSWLYWSDFFEDYWPFSLSGTVTETNVNDDPFTLRLESSHRWSWFDRHAPTGETGHFGYDKPSRWSITLSAGNAQVSDTAGTDRPFLDYGKWGGHDGDLEGIQAVKLSLVKIEKIDEAGKRVDDGSSWTMGEGDFESHVKIEEVEFRRLRFGVPIEEDDSGPGPVIIEAAAPEVAQ